MSLRIILRNDEAANWTAANPILAKGEAGYEDDTGKLKFGDGATDWNSLPYFAGHETATSDGTTGGAGSAGAGNQYVELTIDGITYKVLHDGTV